MLRLITLLIISLFIVYCRMEQCCVPSQIQATLLTADPYVPIMNKTYHTEIFYDFQNKRTRTNFLANGYQMLMFHKENIGYKFNATWCAKDTSGPWTAAQCTPEEATISKPYSVGWKPNITLVDVYWQDGQDTPVQMSFMNCATPIEMVKGSTDNALTRTVFQDYVPTILDKHVFDIPVICKKAPTVKYNLKVPVGYFGHGYGMSGQKYTK